MAILDMDGSRAMKGRPRTAAAWNFSVPIASILTTLHRGRFMGAMLINHRRLFRLAARFYGIRPIDITGPYKGMLVNHARRVVAYVCYHRRNLSYTAVSEIMQRDHTTVMHHVQTMEERMIDDPSLKDVIDAIDKASMKPVKVKMPKPMVDRSEKIPALQSQFASANFGISEKHMEKVWYEKQNQAFVDAVVREYGAEARW